jgi:osmotically-inducible protein OsmY
MEHVEHTEADQTDENQVDGDHQIEQAWHQQNQDARDQGHDGRNVGGSDGHQKLSGMTLKEDRIEGGILSSGAVPR